MGTELETFLAGHRLGVEESVTWNDGLMPLRLHTYLSEVQPPLDYVTSIRAVVLRDNHILVVHDVFGGFHITPGGRCDPGESVEETLRREVLEETGWTLVHPQLLGFVHFYHLAPQPPDYPYPYPDFLQLVFTAQAGEFIPEAYDPGELEVESRFYSVPDVQALGLTTSQRVFLDAATSAHGARR